MKKLIVLFIALLCYANNAQSQGCIMVRNIAGFGQYCLADNAFTTSDWQLNIIGRYFKAYRDFYGTQDQKTAKEDQSIIESYSTDITLSRLMNKGWSVDFSIPIASNSRSATKEHGGLGTNRHVTHAFGIGDMRLSVLKWLLNPTVSQKVNIQIGLGLKLPTGDYRYQDYFYKNHDSTKVLAPVNGSIQLGDGGTGVIAQVNAFCFFNKTIGMYANFYYLINPRDQNGVSTTTGNTPTTNQVKYGNDVLSVPDVYSIRGGLNFSIKKLALSAGLRDEGVPVRDLAGGNYGLRRPGHNLSAEPGVLYKIKNTSVYAYVPVLIARKINQSLPDKQMQANVVGFDPKKSTGGSGNFVVFMGVLFKL